MKKIMIYAYLHFNLGDDLFVEILCQRYPQTKFVLYAPRRYRKTFTHLKNIQYISSNSLIFRGFNFILKLLRSGHSTQSLLAKTCDAAIEVGGSLFIQTEDYKHRLKYTEKLRIKKKPFYLLGANFGPYHDEHFLIEHQNIFKNYTDICFRDQPSYRLFADLENVRVADDIVFTLDVSKVPTTKNNMTISVIKPSNRASLPGFDTIYYSKISEVAMFLIDKGYTVTLMSFCEYEKDHHAIEAIIKLIKDSYHDKIYTYYYQGNIQAALQVIATSRFIIATRFHAMILAWVYKIPVFPIVYSRKMTYVMENVGFRGPYTTIETIHRLELSQILESLQLEPLNISQQSKKAQDHFLNLDQFLTT